MKKMGLHTEGNWCKGNLHTHSTNSDGRKTPEEIVQIYKDHGYQFLAFTEHELYTHNRALSDKDFLILPGVELSCCNPDPWRIYHMLGIGCRAAGDGPSTENGFSDGQRFPVRKWEDLGSAQAVLDEIRQADNLAVFNHPIWSRLELTDFIDLDGYFAMEIYNY